MGLKGAKVGENVLKVLNQPHLVVPGGELALQRACNFRVVFYQKNRNIKVSPSRTGVNYTTLL